MDTSLGLPLHFLLDSFVVVVVEFASSKCAITGFVEGVCELNSHLIGPAKESPNPPFNFGKRPLPRHWKSRSEQRPVARFRELIVYQSGFAVHRMHGIFQS